LCGSTSSFQNLVDMESGLTDLFLTPGQVSLTELGDVYWNGKTVKLDRVCKVAVERAADRIAAAATGDQPVYGVNTGFGKLASIKIAPNDAATLQRNLILSHCCGVGEAIPQRIARLMMSLKLLSFGRGASGVRWDCVELLEQMLERGVTPIIPAQGSVGASGDLAPLSHLSLPLLGAGEVRIKGEIKNSIEILGAYGLSPLELAPKEGLALLNGTQVSTALALTALFKAEDIYAACVVPGAMSVDAAKGSTTPFDPDIQMVRRQNLQSHLHCHHNRLFHMRC